MITSESLAEKGFTSSEPAGLSTVKRERLKKHLTSVSDECTECRVCQEDCRFLQRYGTPKAIADAFNAEDAGHAGIAFECSLCQLCTAVCPSGVDPAEMFLEMRREASERGKADYSEHAQICGYEKRGVSKRYTYYSLPVGCDTVFFPGCTLTGTRSSKVLMTYNLLKKSIPSLGIVLDCCTKPSHDLGRTGYFNAMFGELRGYLLDHGIKEVLVACPNCYKVFKRYGKGLDVKAVYQILADGSLIEADKLCGSVTIHDPCAVRFENDIHSSVRTIVSSMGLAIEEMPHRGENTYCCGEGGSVGFMSPDLAQNWGKLRKEEIGGKRVVTYCAGCANYLGRLAPTSHILDLIFEPAATMDGRAVVDKPPLTYWKRLSLKRRLKDAPAAATRERTFSSDMASRKPTVLKLALFLIFIISVVIAVKMTNATQFMEQERLRSLIQGYGALAPVIYMLVYAVAPVLFLPGLPITVVGGILFGPFWGVVYTICGSTTGACLAFLTSRYLARDWVAGRLKGPSWKRLDKGVERHGWKFVAFTRLIPLFPFNLLNYAFGLTNIRFLHYAVATFICMLPACIAYITFSSSLLDLIRGRVSRWFFAGLLLIIAVSMIPSLYRKYSSKKGIEDPL
ncbi:MAG TPA: VTT domain-containing protein [Dissulfurispiraceae bacterium]|nr:VTT domain-containing protein [Dissulfurispiraceae bacterium]